MKATVPASQLAVLTLAELADQVEEIGLEAVWNELRRRIYRAVYDYVNDSAVVTCNHANIGQCAPCRKSAEEN
jgi:hypothetical protein